jgi:hypothetical protein
VEQRCRTVRAFGRRLAMGLAVAAAAVDLFVALTEPFVEAVGEV